MDTRFGAYISLAGGFVLAGSSVIAGKFLVGLPVFFAAAAGTAIALLVLVPLAAGETRPERGAMRRALPFFAAQAFFGVALFRVLMLAALSRTSASEAGIATGVTPVITALLSALFLRERIGLRAALGIGLAAAGIVALESGAGVETVAPIAHFASRHLVGCFLALGAAASESAFNVLSKRLEASIGPKRASASVMAIALVLLATLSLVTGEKVELNAISPNRGLAFVYQGLFASALAYVLWFTGVAKVPVSTAGVFSGFMPLSSFALSALVLGERPRPAAYAGCLLAIGGILLCASPHRVKDEGRVPA
jgi:drug/metabolite transporter (DMT)-like permease